LVVLLEEDAAYLGKIAHSKKVDRGAYEKLSADRRTFLKALDAFGDTLESLGIDWTDQRNRVARRAYNALQSAFDEWVDARLAASSVYFDSLAGSELARARRAHTEEEGHAERIREKVFGTEAV